VRVEASVWVPRDVDPIRALAALRGGEELEVSIAEIDKDGVRLVAGTWAPSSAERGAMAAGLRAACLERLRVDGLFSSAGD
jgi:hypothetical protein